MPNLERLQSGDEEEWDRVLTDLRWHHSAQCLAARYLGAQWAASVDDVAQEAVIKFVQAVPRCLQESHLLPLLLRITKQQSLDFLRRAARREVPTANLPQIVDEEIDNRERLRQNVAEALDQDNFDTSMFVETISNELALNGALKAILQHHMIEGLTQAELSRMTDIPEGTIARLKAEILRRIRQWFSGIGR